MKKLLLLLGFLVFLPLVQGHMPPRDQAIIIDKETGDYKFEFLIFPKNPQTGVITEIVLNASYLGEESPYTGGVKMRLREVKVEEGISPSFDILEAPGKVASPVQYAPGGYEITVVFTANGTYAVDAWPLGEEKRTVTAEFIVQPRLALGTGFFAFLALLAFLIIGVAYALSRK
jgi:hypothetical protein